MEYNTSRDKLVMPEYGRHIQKMVQHLHTIESPEKRQQNAQLIIELMGALNPHLRIVEDFKHMLWDHLFLIGGFDLDIESPYPKPSQEKLNSRPSPLPYPKNANKLRHLGRNLNAIIEKALVEEDEEKKKGFINTIAYYMKLSYTNWHHEPVPDNTIIEELEEISKGNLMYEGEEIKVRINANNYKRNNKSHKNGNGNKNYKKNNRKPKRSNNNAR